MDNTKHLNERTLIYVMNPENPFTKALRKSRGELSYNRFGKIMGVDNKTAKRWETGIRVPQLRYIINVIHKLNWDEDTVNAVLQWYDSTRGKKQTTKYTALAEAVATKTLNQGGHIADIPKRFDINDTYFYQMRIGEYVPKQSVIKAMLDYVDDVFVYEPFEGDKVSIRRAPVKPLYDVNAHQEFVDEIKSDFKQFKEQQPGRTANDEARREKRRLEIKEELELRNISKQKELSKKQNEAANKRKERARLKKERQEHNENVRIAREIIDPKSDEDSWKVAEMVAHMNVANKYEKLYHSARTDRRQHKRLKRKHQSEILLLIDARYGRLDNVPEDSPLLAEYRRLINVGK